VKKGDIIEYNSLVLAAQVNAWGGEAIRFDHSRRPGADPFARPAGRRNQRFVAGQRGSSAGSEDFTARVIAELAGSSSTG
jgi:molybdopterin biosynthesis enzyme